MNTYPKTSKDLDFNLKRVQHSNEQIIDFIKSFFKSFDTKDWNLMEGSLAETVELDYESFRGEPMYYSTSKDYVEKRKVGLKALTTNHKSSSYVIIRKGSEINFLCDYEINRYAIDSEAHFHSYGKYDFWIEEKDERLKIYRIKQLLERNEGDKNIHGAFKKE